ncbi:hypothetical protein B7P43_G08625 [Cryptotermes secundus]|uniref:ATP-dependent DNA helicase n=1 Tax=Cryptotermes secundus TaxID=105785 RepID=A0A2J7Q626_9NEOP|nr:hypothetical protein B7P43_G08625 [Cryptotermes secundus]
MQFIETPTCNISKASGMGKVLQKCKLIVWDECTMAHKSNVVEATILTGPFKGEYVLIPRIPMIPADVPFQFKRLQFPIRLAFAITINKVQGQSLELCGLDLDTDCFSHGQLYVACSRVGKPDNLYICTDNGTTKSNVYPQAL